MEKQLISYQGFVIYEEIFFFFYIKNRIQDKIKGLDLEVGKKKIVLGFKSMINKFQERKDK